MKKKSPSGFMIMLMWIGLCVGLLVIGSMIRVALNPNTSNVISFESFIKSVENNEIKSVNYKADTHTIWGEYKESKVIKNYNRMLVEPASSKESDKKSNIVSSFSTYGNLDKEIYLQILKQHDIIPTYIEEDKPSLLEKMIPMMMWGFGLMLVIYILTKLLSKGNANITSFGSAKIKQKESVEADISFNDIAGIDEAKEDILEIIDFLKNPLKYQKIGAKVPKGALLIGNPGTGKTLLAKAIAKEANAEFFSMAGSEFVEMFVGVGASRVRDLFKIAREKAPSIIFIDEIDAIGHKRSSSGETGSSNESSQTLNQLLIEMNGMGPADHVIIIAATNRLEVLDPALIRAGRFDRKIHIPLPDLKGREAILKVHSKKVVMNENVDLSSISKNTTGYSGADLANIVNEAALKAVKDGRESIGLADFEFAKDKVSMGAERRSLQMTLEEKTSTAYHEIGHALVLLKTNKKVNKVSIVPRGRALGITEQLNDDYDSVSLTKNDALNQIAMLMGGRCAEEIINNEYSTGASNDIARASELARRMVCEWGMSALGPISFGKDSNGYTSHLEYSQKTHELIDKEVSAIIDNGYALAKDILQENQELLKKLTLLLLEKETIYAKDIEEVISLA